MSYITGKPEPNQVTLKPGVYQSKPTKGGLNLNKWLMRALKKVGFAGTADPNCCQYFPTVPEILVANINAPTAEEMVNVPVGGFFRATDANGIWNIFIRNGEGASYSSSLATNN